MNVSKIMPCNYDDNKNCQSYTPKINYFSHDNLPNLFNSRTLQKINNINLDIALLFFLKKTINSFNL